MGSPRGPIKEPIVCFRRGASHPAYVDSVLASPRGLPMQNQRRKADQPVAELKTALAQSERELAEAREREAATANILKIISSSPGNLQPVFDAIAQSAARLLGAHSAAVTRVAGDDIHLAAFTSGSE